jgi:hypothetical protein
VGRKRRAEVTNSAQEITCKRPQSDSHVLHGCS